MLSLYFAELQRKSQVGPCWQLNRPLATSQKNALEKSLKPKDSSGVITSLPWVDDVFVKCFSVVVWMNA
jgi:hypothetical protein